MAKPNEQWLNWPMLVLIAMAMVLSALVSMLLFLVCIYGIIQTVRLIWHALQ